MSSRARGPNVLKGALVTIDPANPTPNIIAFSYNPASLRHQLQPQQVDTEGDRSAVMHFTGAPVQTISVDIEIDVSDQLDAGDPDATRHGELPQLAALKLLIHPSLVRVGKVQGQLADGAMKGASFTALTTLFVWGENRALPVQLNSYDITEEIFDSRLDPVIATVTLTMRVLSHPDLSADHRKYYKLQTYQQALNSLASISPTSSTGVGVDPGSL